MRSTRHAEPPERGFCGKGLEPARVAGSARLLVLAALLCGACTGDVDDDTPVDPGGDRPNVVLIIVDTLRADMLSSYGHAANPSPGLSSLAARGVQFDSVIAQSSWTLPSIGSMLASRHPRELGLYDEGNQVLSRRFEILSEVFQSHGYATFGATANPNINSRFQFDQGFDRYVDSVVVFRESRDQLEEGEIFFQDSNLHPAKRLFRQAHEFVAGQDVDTPVYLQLDLMEVHEYAPGREMLRPNYADMFQGEEAVHYLRAVRQVTDDILLFLRELGDLPGWDDALFCVTSDHGEGLFDHPAVPHSQGHGALLYPSTTGVPWILCRNGWSPKVSSVSQEVRLLELAPTLLDLAGIDSPPGMRGVSLKPLIEGKQTFASMPEYIITETYFREFRRLSAYGADWQYVDNRDSIPQLPDHELQSRTGVPNGAVTDMAARRPNVVEHMQHYVEAWEAGHEEAPTTIASQAYSEDVRRQLRAIGYDG